MAESNLTNAVYEELGLRTVIHAAGTITSYGGSRMREEVLDAMAAASKSFVSIADLNRRVGEYISEVTGAEAGMVTSGAAGGVVLSIAACMTGTDVVKVRRLPDSTGMKNELVIQKIHRGGYSHMYTFAGARFVEVGDTNSCLPEEVDAAINERTAAVAYLLGPGVYRGGLSLPEIAEIAHARGVPVIVDAAAMLPPRDNPRRYIREGADLVTMSGGKFIRGPQATGLLFGRRDLIEAAMLNNSPNHAIGRPHKVAREEMVGLYTALRLYMESDEEAMIEEYRRTVKPVVDELIEIPGLHVSIEHDDFKYHVPTAVVRFQRGWRGRSGPEIAKSLIDGEPSIFLLHDRNNDALSVNPINLQDGEAEIVARRLREELERA